MKSVKIHLDMSSTHNFLDLLHQRLEVRPDASRDEIVSAYRRLARRTHPDTRPADPDAARRFREITEAYEVLSGLARHGAGDRTGADRSIRVVDLTGGSGSLASPQRVPVENDGPTVVLGTIHRRIRGAQLRAGPVRVEQPSPQRSAAARRSGWRPSRLRGRTLGTLGSP
jgi:curved DNA-binding protein CbpA